MLKKHYLGRFFWVPILHNWYQNMSGFAAGYEEVLATQYYMWSPETVQIVKWKRDTFEFDQPYKQVESKMQVTWKISSDT